MSHTSYNYQTVIFDCTVSKFQLARRKEVAAALQFKVKLSFDTVVSVNNNKIYSRLQAQITICGNNIHKH